MRVIIHDRYIVYKIVRECLDVMGIHPWCAELGVLDGRNAEVIDQIIKPERLMLIDAWSSKAFEDYTRYNAHRPWVSHVDSFDHYFGGPVSEQATMDRLYDAASTRFRDKGHVTLVKGSTLNSIAQIEKLLGTRKLDYIYVDASHQYESVLDDLMFYEKMLSLDGILQLNDCCHSRSGVSQNLGVLEATLSFMKIADFEPVLITNTDFSDIVLTRRRSNINSIFDMVFETSEISYVDVPSQLLGALRVKTGKRVNLSFC